MSKKKKKSEPAPEVVVPPTPPPPAPEPIPVPATPDPAANYKPTVQTPEGYSSVRNIEFKYETSLKNLQGDIEKELEDMRTNAAIKSTQLTTDAQRYIADTTRDTSLKSTQLTTDAQRYIADVGRDSNIRSTELSANAQRYVADVGQSTAFGVADRESKGRLDLQAIVNAGLKDVATTQAEAQKSVATIQGDYSLQGEKERQRGQRDVADLTSKRGMYASLMSAFNF